MTMLLHDGTNHNGLFDLLGKCFHALDVLNTATLTTVPAEVVNFLVASEFVTGATGQPGVSDAIIAISGMPGSLASWQGGGSTLSSGLQQAAQSLLTAWTQAANASLGNDLLSNMAYLVAQMTAGTVTGGDHVTAPTASVTAAAAVGNVGNVQIAATLVRGDGQTQQNVLPETINATVQTAGIAPTLALASPPVVSDRTSYLWPGGSGLSRTLSTISAANSLLSNGSFENDAIANQPDDWLIAVGTPGTTLFVTGQCTNTVTIGGTPTGGSYILTWTDAQGTHRATAPLPYNATASQVQAALRAIGGLELVTVSTTGTTPDFTHTVTFSGVGGAVSTLSYISQLTGGSPTVTCAVGTAADANTLAGQALKIVGNGSELTAIYSVLPTLTANTTYILGFWARTKAADTIAAGELKAEILDGIGGSVIADAAGTSNALTVNLTTLSNSVWTFFSLTFRIPNTIIQPAYLRIRLSTAITSGKTVYLDEMAIGIGTQLYAGGPIAAAFSGSAAANLNDTWTITVANNLAGKFQKDFNRIFGMADLGLLLPTTGGGSLIDDSLIA